jgi:hypothetical protein
MRSTILHSVIALGLVGALGCTEGESREAPEPDEVAEEQRTPEPRHVDETPAERGRTDEEGDPVDEDHFTVPSGTEIAIRLLEDVSTDTHRTGDAFSAIVDGSVTDADGAVLIPAGTSVRGLVAEARPSAGADEQAVLVLTVESLAMDGETWPIRGTMRSAELESDAKDSTSETVGKVAVGAAAGAIVGQILGKDTESTLKGAGVGAVAGAIVAFTTRDGHATAPAGSVLVIGLDESLTL